MWSTKLADGTIIREGQIWEDRRRKTPAGDPRRFKIIAGFWSPKTQDWSFLDCASVRSLHNGRRTRISLKRFIPSNYRRVRDEQKELNFARWNGVTVVADGVTATPTADTSVSPSALSALCATLLHHANALARNGDDRPQHQAWGIEQAVFNVLHLLTNKERLGFRTNERCATCLTTVVRWPGFQRNENGQWEQEEQWTYACACSHASRSSQARARQARQEKAELLVVQAANGASSQEIALEAVRDEYKEKLAKREEENEALKRKLTNAEGTLEALLQKAARAESQRKQVSQENEQLTKDLGLIVAATEQLQALIPEDLCPELPNPQRITRYLQQEFARLDESERLTAIVDAAVPQALLPGADPAMRLGAYLEQRDTVSIPITVEVEVKVPREFAPKEKA